MRRYLFFGTQRYALAILRPLQEAIRRRGDEVAWFLQGPAARCLRPDELLLGTVAAVKAYAPCAVFVPGNVVPDFFPGLKVDVFHGFNARKRPAQRGHYRMRGFFDLYCTQGPNTTRAFKHLARSHGFFEVCETGWPKMDPLFASGADTRDPHGAHGRPVVLLTSTFTPRLSCALPLLDTIRRLAVGNPWRWQVHFHPKMDPQTVARYRSLSNENLEFVDHDDVIPLLRAADVMVSDTSSILSEFLLLKKPVVTFRNRRPGPHLIDIRDPSELETAIARALERPPALIEAIGRYADDIHPYRDGRSSERVLAATDDLVARGRGHLRPKPLNLVRRFKLRRQLRYYRWR